MKLISLIKLPIINKLGFGSSTQPTRANRAQFQWIQLDSKVTQLGRELLMKYGTTGLRTLDAIQLASALTLKEQPKIYFFTADQLLQSCFEQEGLATIS